MAGAESVVLFQRGEEEDYDSDVWDDTALIEAYDAAVAPLKAKLAEHTGDASFLEGVQKQSSSAHHKKKKNKRKKSKKKQQAAGWRVGDQCQAVYTEDGEIYEAKIISISPESSTCIVRYLGYGNEEEQSLEDLMPSTVSASMNKKPKHQQNDSVSCSESDSVEIPRQSSKTSHQGNKGKKASSSRSSGFPSFSWPWSSGAPGSMSPHPPHGPLPPPMFTGMPLPGSLPGFSFPHHDSSASMPLPPMPPPPPPMSTGDMPDENEALCSMLLSWYMSGYHTGYYQGLKQGRQQYEVNGSAASAMGPS